MEEIIHQSDNPSHFLLVKCPKCKNDKQVIFNKASSIVRCLICNQILAKPKGSKAEIKCRVLEKY